MFQATTPCTYMTSTLCIDIVVATIHVGIFCKFERFIVVLHILCIHSDLGLRLMEG